MKVFLFWNFMRTLFPASACKGFYLILGVVALLVALPYAAAQTIPGTSAGDDLRTQRLQERPGRTGLPLPRFVSLGANEINLRAGPGFRYPIEWVYKSRFLPVEVIDEFENWRQIRDWEGSTGWVHHSMLSGRRYGMVLDDELILKDKPEDDAKPLARVAAGALGEIERCSPDWCRISFQGTTGWLPKAALFGVYEHESLR